MSFLQCRFAKNYLNVANLERNCKVAVISVGSFILLSFPIRVELCKLFHFFWLVDRLYKSEYENKTNGKYECWQMMWNTKKID